MWRRGHRRATCITGALLLLASFATGGARGAEQEGVRPEKVIDIAAVWSAHPVGFCLLTEPPHQFVAFYDDQRRLTVAARRLDTETWRFARLPEQLGWDSHNYVTMAMDGAGHIHLAGNMHCNPLVYFRTARPHDIETFQRVREMVGAREDRCTYPRFLRGPADELIFTYRDGGSGNGDQLYNVYDPGSAKWRRLLDQPLTSGLGRMNAYLHGPVRDGFGMYHLCWVWRDTPDCATNHDLCYARSRDLVRWETSAGKVLDLPIVLETAEIVDPVPPGGGMINGNTFIGFDSQDRPIISYHKFDEQGLTQAYSARLEAGRWKIYQTSDWTYRWEFKGGGSIQAEIRLSAVTPLAGGGLRQSYRHARHGSGVWHLDERTLKPIGEAPASSPTAGDRQPQSAPRPEMQARSADDLGSSGEAGMRYVLRWETLGANRDRPRTGPPTAPSMLRLHCVRTAAAGEPTP